MHHEGMKTTTSKPATNAGNRADCPILCDLYLRLSDGRRENGSFAEREAALRARAAQLGWQVNRVVIENDVMSVDGKSRKSASAFKRRKVVLPDGSVVYRVFRPGFRLILDDLAAGRAHAILAEDLDRSCRDPRDLEDLVDVIRLRRAWADSLSGSLKFTAGGTDSEVAMARVMVTMAAKSSHDTGRRVAAGRERKASKGEYGGGPRPYGFEPDGTTVRTSEAEVIQKMAEAVLAPIALREIVRDLNTRGIPAAQGGKWRSVQVKDVLCRARNAGILVYAGQEIGEAPWDPILELNVYRAVVDKLTDPSRAVLKGGRAHRWLGTGIYRCVCGATMDVHSRAGQSPRYRCRTKRDEGGTGVGHVTRDVEALDEYVTALVIARLSRPDFVDGLCAPSNGADLPALRREAAALRERLGQLAESFADGEIDRGQLLRGTARIKAELTEVEAEMSAVVSVSPLTPLVTATDIAGAWLALDLGARRAVLSALVTVTILPCDELALLRELLTRLRSGADRSNLTVGIEWNS